MAASLPAQRDDRSLFEHFAATRDPVARGELAARYLPLARSIARKFSGPFVEDDDLIQVASVGLLHALDRYDPGKGTAFSSFAVPTIAGTVRRHLRDHSWTVRPPRELQERALNVRKRASELAAANGRSPTANELAAEMGMDLESVVEALQGMAARQGVSLSRPVDSGDEGSRTLGDTLGEDDAGLLRAEDAMTIEHLVDGLPAREREIIRLRFEEDLTQAEIGEHVGLSQMRVSRILRAVLRDLNEAARAERPEPAGITAG
jgi:RNA polymerase sigma-B factor